MTDKNEDKKQIANVAATASTIGKSIGTLWTLCVSVAGVWIVIYFIGAVVHRMGM